MTSSGDLFDLDSLLNGDEPITPRQQAIQQTQPRQRLKPWLEDQVNSGAYPGLEWINKEEKVFKIPWKHFGKPGDDDMKYAMLFCAWAVHTGKYNQEKPHDVSRWKTNFRCALDRQSEVEKLTDLFKTDVDQPFRTYKFLSSAATVVKTTKSPLPMPLHFGECTALEILQEKKN